MKIRISELLLITLCLIPSTGLLASNTADAKCRVAVDATPADTMSMDTVVSQARYTFGDFFDALDLPTVFGAGYTPNHIESASFTSSVRLGWRHHKNYGTYAYIAYNTHSNTYDSLTIAGSNVYNGEVWYHEIGMGVGYRIPLVKDIRAFYAQPYFHAWDFFCAIEPGAKITVLKNVVPDSPNNEAGNTDKYSLIDATSVVPTLRFSAGVEWFIFPNFAIFVEAAYTQHLLPTVVEQAAINQGRIKHPSGPMTFSAGLSLFFN